MVNYIWIAFIVIGIVYAMINGTIDNVTEAIFTSANEAVTLTIGFISVFVFWLGMMRIAERTGFLQMIMLIIRPIILLLFPELPKDHPVIQYIISNIAANLFGLGNAATPLGIKAMKAMKTLHPSNEASRSMITFLALNTSGLTIFPATVVALRIKYGAVDPLDIVIAALIATSISTVSAIFFDRLFYYLDERKRRIKQ